METAIVVVKKGIYGTLFGSAIMMFLLLLLNLYLRIDEYNHSLTLYEKLQDLHPHIPISEDGVLWPAAS